MRSRAPGLAALALAVAVAACGPIIPPPREPVAPAVAVTPPARTPENALVAGVEAGPPVGRLALLADKAGAALRSFRESCPRLTARTDNSGLTRPDDWRLSCSVAQEWPADDAASFFNRYFETARVGEGRALVTGYYEPEIAGVRAQGNGRQAGFDVPVYGLPADLVRARPGDAPPLENGQQPLGRYDESGKFVPYWDRAAIAGGALFGKGLEIGWAADWVEFFFLQVQGSGRLRAPDGSMMRLGFAGQNGQPYTGIGGVMRARGLIGSGPGQYSGSMQGIMQYLRDNPEAGRALMAENRSWVFFRELAEDHTVGALGVPVRARASLAADPAYVPLGAPVWLSLDRSEASGLWIAQDTGGAIKGANRFDSFWGAGAEARTIAGGMSGRGEAYVLLPRGTLRRLPGK